MNKYERQPVIYDLLNLPPQLFKYYGYDSTLNEKRLSGEVYLATPFDFNDPCDCQRDVINNSKEKVNKKGVNWLCRKLQELGYTDKETERLSISLQKDDTDKYEVYKRQLEKVGILCLTTNHADSLMWGYYTNNEGFCIEYDVTQIIRQLVVGFVNNIDYVTTKQLFNDNNYKLKPKVRTSSLNDNYLQLAETYFTIQDVELINNTFLKEQSEQEIVYFLQNIYLKRLAGSSIEYKIGPDGSPGNLFFERDSNINATSKYFKKTTVWEHEKEFRIIISLGGKQVIKLNNNIIKSIYLGCNMKNEKIMEVVYMIQKLSLNKVKLYKMKRLKNCGLQAVSIDMSKLTGDVPAIENYLNQRCSLYW